MKSSENRILTTHTGSLPRPAGLTELYSRRSLGEGVNSDDLARIRLDAVRTAVAKQIDVGIDVGNNGEQSREAFFLYVRDRLSGLGGSWRRPNRADVERYPAFKRMFQAQGASKVSVSNVERMPKAIGDVRYGSRALIDAECSEFSTVLAAGGGAFCEQFMSSPSPGILATGIANEFYDTQAAYIDALARAMKVEYEAIVAHGFLLQIDAPDLALERHMTFADRPLSVFLGFVEQIVAAINGAIANIPRDKVRLHVCWGNSETPHDCDVPLRDILPILRQANVGGLVLPFANPRHAHEIRDFKQLPLADDQVLVVGAIDSLTNIIEHEEVVAERLERAARVIGDPCRILAGTDCGFDTSAGAGRVAEDVVWAKLASLKAGARLASQRLFSRGNRD